MRASACVLNCPAVEELAFEGGEEALRHGVVIGVPDRSHRGADASLPTSFAEFDRGILRALIRMVDHARSAAADRAPCRGRRAPPAYAGRRHRPADDPSAERVQHDGQIEEAGPRWNIRDVGHPQRVRALRREVAVDQIRRLTRPIPDGRDLVPARLTPPGRRCASAGRHVCGRCEVAYPVDSGQL